MNTRNTQRLLWLVLVLLVIVTIAVWVPLLSAQGHRVLTVSFLNVGQGDAVFIQTPSGRQILVDGGPDAAVLRELGATMPFFDRSLDMVIATHPDADHISGLTDVLKRFKVSLLLRPGVEHDTPALAALLRSAASAGVRELRARRGQTFDFGDGVILTVLFPDRDATRFETNTASVVVRVTFGDQSFLFTGDSPQAIEEYLVSLDGEQLRTTVLKAGHHGSRTSSSKLFVGFVDPEYVVLSRGCRNRYGHPHQETLDTLHAFGVDIRDTCTDGRITFETDGTTLTVK